MARVGDAIMENGRNFWTKLTMHDEEDRKDRFLVTDSMEERGRSWIVENLVVLRFFFRCV
jgi:hypothetical protein